MKKRPKGKNFGAFSPRYSQNYVLNRNISRWTQSGPFSKIREIAGLKVCNFIKKRLQHGCFPVNIVKFLRTTNLKNIYEWLLSKLFNTLLRSSGRMFKKNLPFTFVRDSMTSQQDMVFSHKPPQKLITFWFMYTNH